MYFAYTSALKGVVKDYPYTCKDAWEGMILLFPEPGEKGDYNFLWQYLVASAQKSFLFFLLFLQPPSYSFQGKSFFIDSDVLLFYLSYVLARQISYEK